MKLIYLLTLVSMQLALGQTEAQVKPSRFMFKLSPQHLVQNCLKVGGEFFNKSNTTSTVVFLRAVSNNAGHDPYPLFPYSGGGLEVNYRKYMAPIQTITSRKGRPYTQGIYFSFFFQGGLFKGDYDYREGHYDPQTQTHTEEHVVYLESAQNLATGFSIGLQRVYWNILTVDAFLGGGYQLGSSSKSGTPPANSYAVYPNSFDDAGYTGVIPKGGVLIGVFIK